MIKFADLRQGDAWPMSFLLCHDCYTWVEPQDDRCPECWLTMDLSAVDPTLAALRDEMGSLVECLGLVRIPRRVLPEWGMLYATTSGLFFFPQDVSPTTATEYRRSRIWETILWRPLAFFVPALRQATFEERPELAEVFQDVPRIESLDLPQLLMDNPGTFFLPRRQIRRVFRKRSRVIIERHSGGRRTIAPIEPARQFQKRVGEFVQSRDPQTAMD